MTGYLALVPKYLRAHKNKTRLTLMSVVISVALITAVFSMLDALMRFEKIQMIHDYGNYHIVVKGATDAERAAISSRIEVAKTGRWKDLGTGSINSVDCLFGALDPHFAGNMGINLIDGSYPAAENEIMLQEWSMEKISPELEIGHTVMLALPGGRREPFVISGICSDNGVLKSKGVPGVFLSNAYADKVEPEKEGVCFVQFKDGVNIARVERQIKQELGISGDRIIRNERLLAVMGQSDHKAAVGLYAVGVILFLIVLIAGVVMIYNTFNISVMDRIRQFGLLRCIGASQAQIRKLVRREGLYLTRTAIPLGLVAGILVGFACSGILKFYNRAIFGMMPLFIVSIPGLAAGITIGFLTVFIAVLAPARKAARVSPVNAVTGGNEMRVGQSRKKGILTRLCRAEIGMGIANALVRKRTLVLMASSVAISIIMFLGFQVLVDFVHSSLKTTKPYTPDVTLVSAEGMDDRFYRQISGLEGVRTASRRMLGHVKATFAVSRLTDEYRQSLGDIKVYRNGLFDPTEETWLISYDEHLLKWAKDECVGGTLNAGEINAVNGVIAVVRNFRKGVGVQNVRLEVGDNVYVETAAGTKKLPVVGLLQSVPFSDSKLNLTTLITTEKVFTELTGVSSFPVIDVQLHRKNQEQTVRQIKDLAYSRGLEFLDSRQKNAEMDQTFFTMALFVYGFVLVIALISALNIINTMNTGITAKTQYLGVMRAIGMSQQQLNRMALVEALTYNLTGAAAGCILGVWLQKRLIETWLTLHHVVWKLPLIQLALILAFVSVMTAVSVIGPLKRLRAKGICDMVKAL